MNPMRRPRHLPTSVLAALAERVSGTYPACISEADELITWVTYIIWTTCIAIRDVAVDDPYYAISVALGAPGGAQSGDGHRWSCPRVVVVGLVRYSVWIRCNAIYELVIGRMYTCLHYSLLCSEMICCRIEVFVERTVEIPSRVVIMTISIGQHCVDVYTISMMKSG